MQRLASYRFEWVLPGHGQRMNLPAGEMRGLLSLSQACNRNNGADRMRWLRRRAWYLTAIVLGLAAVVVDLRGKSIIAGGVGTIARMTQAKSDGASSEVIKAMKALGVAETHRGGNWSTVGFLVAIASALSFFVSRVKFEPGPRIVPIAVWTVYISFLFVVV